MVILRLLIIASLTIIHLGVVQLNDVAGGRPVHEEVGKHPSIIMARRDKGFQIESTIHIRKAFHWNNIRDHNVAVIPSKSKPIIDPKHSHTHQAPSIRSPSSLFCRHDQFACDDGVSCIPKSELCNGYGGCKDLSHTTPSQCNNCADDHLFKCKRGGVDVCLNSKFKCDGVPHCSDYGDELMSD